LETIAEPLEFVCFLRLEMNNGKSLRRSLQATVMTFQTTFSAEVSRWWEQREAGKRMDIKKTSAAVQQFYHLLDISIDGTPIQEPLAELEAFMIEICKEDVNEHLERLPTIMMVPMVLCFYPAFLLLIVSPAMSYMRMGLS